MIGWRCRLLVRTAHAPRSLVASSTFSSFWLFLPSRISSSGRFLPQNRRMREGHIFDKISPTWTLISDISRGDGKVNSSSPQWGNCERNGICLYILVSAGKQKNIINLENYWFLPSPKWKVFGRINQNRELINFRNFGSPASQKTTAITTHDSWQIQQKVIQRCSLIIGAKLGLKEKRERKSTTHALLLKKKNQTEVNVFFNEIQVQLNLFAFCRRFLFPIEEFEKTTDESWLIVERQYFLYVYDAVLKKKSLPEKIEMKECEMNITIIATKAQTSTTRPNYPRFDVWQRDVVGRLLVAACAHSAYVAAFFTIVDFDASPWLLNLPTFEPL